MPSTYTLISSNVLSSSAATVTFSAIPSTYTDLVLRASVRTDRAAYIDSLFIRFNSLSTTIYSGTDIETSNGSSVGSFRISNNTSLGAGLYVDGNTATSNTFANFEMYLPSYTASQSKPMSFFTVSENNATSAGITAEAGLFRDNGAISTILIGNNNGPNFVSGSSFYLYGVKSS
jgi:hypothetical protein